jgi:hypothetical protein
MEDTSRQLLELSGGEAPPQTSSRNP